MTVGHIYRRFKEFGGWHLLWEYMRIGVAGNMMKSLLKGEGVKQVYGAIGKTVNPYLLKKYYKKNCEVPSTPAPENNGPQRIIWTCWMQGIDKAPETVKVCLQSYKNFLKDYDIRVVDDDTFEDLVEMPDYVVEKYKKGIIPKALFADILRLELLIKYGGVWIDCTVLCTGWQSGSELEKRVRRYLEAELFMFRYNEVNIGSWFIAAWPQNRLLIRLRDMIYAYWRDYDVTLQYYLIHLFFTALTNDYPELIANMPKERARNSLWLLHHWDNRFDEKTWEALTSQVAFHKLSCRPDSKLKEDRTNYYSKIIE